MEEERNLPENSKWEKKKSADHISTLNFFLMLIGSFNEKVLLKCFWTVILLEKVNRSCGIFLNYLINFF